MARLRVIHVLPNSPFGGAQVLAANLCRQQRAHGLDSSLLLLAGPGQTSHPMLTDVTSRCIASDQVHRWQLCRKHLCARQPDIIHAHMPPPWLYLALPTGVRLVTHLHTRPSARVHRPSLRRLLESLAQRALHRRSHAVIAISQWSLEAWRKFDPRSLEDAQVIYNAIPDAPVLANSLGRVLRIGVATRLDERRGVEELIELALACEAKAIDCTFQVAGDGPLRAKYAEQVSAVGLGQRIRFLGFVADMTGFWSSVDCGLFTAPLSHEPFGLRLLEPLAYARPVLAYLTKSGADEPIRLCRGFLEAKFGDTEMMCSNIVDLNRQYNAHHARAKLGRSDVRERFSLPKMFREVESVYQSVMDCPLE